MEIDNFDYMVVNLVGMLFVVVEGEVVYLLVVYDYLDVLQQLECDWVIVQLKFLFEDESKVKVG